MAKNAEERKIMKEKMKKMIKLRWANNERDNIFHSFLGLKKEKKILQKKSIIWYTVLTNIVLNKSYFT